MARLTSLQDLFVKALHDKLTELAEGIADASEATHRGATRH